MSQMISNDSNIATPSTSMKHLIAAAQDKREQPRYVALPHSISIEETENSIMFISSPSINPREWFRSQFTTPTSLRW